MSADAEKPKSNVVAFDRSGEATINAAELKPNADLIADLEAALELARSGQMRAAFVCAALQEDRPCWRIWGQLSGLTTYNSLLLAALAAAQHSVVQSFGD